ncbi:MAG: hypothetical protein AAFX94_12330 [Myxococcota bacterium]
MLLPMMLCAMSGDVSVLPLAARRVEPDIVLILDDVLTAEVAKNHDGRVIGTRDLGSLLDVEQMKDALGCNDVACAAEIGGALGTEYLVSGSVSILGEEILIQLSLINTDSIVVEARAESTVRNEETQYADGVRQAVARLYNVPIQAPRGAKVTFTSSDSRLIRARVETAEGVEHECKDLIAFGKTCALAGLPPGETTFTFETENNGSTVKTVDVDEEMARLDYRLDVTNEHRTAISAAGFVGVLLGLGGLRASNRDSDGNELEERRGSVVALSVASLVVGTLLVGVGVAGSPKVNMTRVGGPDTPTP